MGPPRLGLVGGARDTLGEPRRPAAGHPHDPWAGTMGQAIAQLATQGGHTATLHGRAGADQPITGDTVILAVQHPALAEIVADRGEELAGKVVVDITNPLDFTTFDSLAVPADSSAAAGLAEALPGARVLEPSTPTSPPPSRRGPWVTSRRPSWSPGTTPTPGPR